MLNALEEDRRRDGHRYTDGPAESSAGYGSRTSPLSLPKFEKILDDNGEGTKRVEETLGPARLVKTGHLSAVEAESNESVSLVQDISVLHDSLTSVEERITQ